MQIRLAYRDEIFFAVQEQNGIEKELSSYIDNMRRQRLFHKKNCMHEMKFDALLDFFECLFPYAHSVIQADLRISSSVDDSKLELAEAEIREIYTMVSYSVIICNYYIFHLY